MRWGPQDAPIIVWPKLTARLPLRHLRYFRYTPVRDQCYG